MKNRKIRMCAICVTGLAAFSAVTAAPLLAPTDVYVSINTFTENGEKITLYAQTRVVAATSLDEANAVRLRASGDRLYGPGDERWHKIFKCSDVLGAPSTGGWWGLVILNNFGGWDEAKKANGAFTCGHRSFEDALRATYVRAAAAAKRDVISIEILAGIASSVTNINLTNNSIQAPYAWGCLLSLPSTRLSNGVEYKQRMQFEPLPASPIDPNSPEAGRLLKQACRASKFQSLPQGYDAASPPSF